MHTEEIFKYIIFKESIFIFHNVFLIMNLTRLTEIKINRQCKIEQNKKKLLDYKS